MIRAAAYIRVSTERQAEEDRVSLGEQSKDIATYCLDKGYTVVKEYQDVGSGASKRRPGFQQLLRDVLDGAAGPTRNVVVVNAAAALLAVDRVSKLKQGVNVASESIDSGAAKAKLDAFIKLSQSLE